MKRSKADVARHYVLRKARHNLIMALDRIDKSRLLAISRHKPQPTDPDHVAALDALNEARVRMNAIAWDITAGLRYRC